MNLLERIEGKLADLNFRIDPSVFEACATHLLSERFPHLNPISGGSDSGRDADLPSAVGEPPIRVAITSSRSFEGAKENLRKSIRSLKQHNMPGTSIISASLAELNQSKRSKLEKLATDEGFELVAVVDRAYFAQRLRTEGEWRVRLLQLPGGPFSLSRTSGHGSLDQHADALVGRGELIEQISDLQSDAVIWGPPGVGKSAALERIPGLYFVDGQPSAERLLDDITSSGPRFVAVDDAARRMDVLDLLVQIRKHEPVSYAVLAVCWPHQREEIALHLVAPVEVEVELLTRREIFEIVRQRGITGNVTLARVLDQARGRPGWAIRLADLLKMDTEWRSVYSGDALRGEIKTYLLRAGLPEHSFQLLAVIGLLGGVADKDIGRLSRSLGMSRIETARTISEVAVGGLLDVRHARVWNVEPETSYTVAPGVLATSIVSAVFFGDEVPPMSVQELFEAWPEKRLLIATAVIRAALLGAAAATGPARRLFAEVVDAAEVSGDREELLHHYLHLGEREAKQVLDRVVTQWQSPQSANEISSRVIRSSAENLVPYFAEALQHVGLTSAADFAIQVAAALEAQGAGAPEFLKKFVDAVRGFGPDERVHLQLVVDVWQRANRASHSHLDESKNILVGLVRECMRPTFEASWMGIESPRSVQIASGLISPSGMSLLFENVWKAFEQLDPDLTRDQLVSLIDVVQDWTQVAHGASLAFGATATTEQIDEALPIARRIADWVLARCGSFPGLRATIRLQTRRIGMVVPEEDPLVGAFFDTREPGDDWRAWTAAYRVRIGELLQPYLQDPEQLCEFLAFAKTELSDVRGWRIADPVRVAFSVIDEASADRSTWVKTAHRHNLFPEADVLLRNLLRVEKWDRELIRELLADPGARTTVIAEALQQESSSSLFQLVQADITPDDIGSLQLAIHRESCSESVIQSLLEHRTPGVRSAIAAALLASTEEPDALRPATFDGAWRRAIQELHLPIDFNLVFGRHDFFEKLVQRFPDVYEELILRLTTASDEEFDWRAFHDTFADTATLLPREAKTRIWTSTGTSNLWRPTIFRALAGNDSEWINSLLAAEVVDPEFVLDTVTGAGVSPSVEDLARLLVPRGCDPTRIASTVQYGTGWGEEHERLARHLALMDTLSESDEAELRAVGSAGRAYFTPLHERALKEARQKEIRGEL